MPVPHVIRTLAIVRRLADGETLMLPDGVLAMGKDMSIGYAIRYAPDDWRISPLVTMDLAALDALLTYHGIGHPLPSTPVQDHVSRLSAAGLRSELDGLRGRALKGE